MRGADRCYMRLMSVDFSFFSFDYLALAWYSSVDMGDLVMAIVIVGGPVFNLYD